ncbi:MAG: hypothetical protein HZA93_23690 [Verrucomicrobia bacterium]|nr:hypothetical protein [Verrucomicrobiota bacterium]
MRHYPAHRHHCAPAGIEHSRAPARPGLAFVTGLVVGATLAIWGILLFATPLS